MINCTSYKSETELVFKLIYSNVGDFSLFSLLDLTIFISYLQPEVKSSTSLPGHRPKIYSVFRYELDSSIIFPE